MFFLLFQVSIHYQYYTNNILNVWMISKKVSIVFITDQIKVNWSHNVPAHNPKSDFIVSEIQNHSLKRWKCAVAGQRDIEKYFIQWRLRFYVTENTRLQVFDCFFKRRVKSRSLKSYLNTQLIFSNVIEIITERVFITSLCSNCYKWNPH